MIAQRVASAAHGRAFAAYNAARNAAELGALGAGGVLGRRARRPQLLVIAGLGPVIAALLGLPRYMARAVAVLPALAYA